MGRSNLPNTTQFFIESPEHWYWNLYSHQRLCYLWTTIQLIYKLSLHFNETQIYETTLSTPDHAKVRKPYVCLPDTQAKHHCNTDQAVNNICPKCDHHFAYREDIMWWQSTHMDADELLQCTECGLVNYSLDDQFNTEYPIANKKNQNTLCSTSALREIMPYIA